jgi:glutathione synthase/RimK-type ligase-like ATP-grasp enzyme
MRIKLHPYKLGSQSCKLLAQVMGNKIGRKVLRVGNNYKAKPRDTIINWGNHHSPVRCHINQQPIVANAANKLITLKMLQEVNVPTVEWTVDPQLAIQWVWEDAIIYSRYSLNGQGGAGIRVYKGKQDYDSFIHAPRAPLFTKYFSAKAEYRVHVCNGEVIGFARKRKRNGVEGNKYVRNLANGYIFARVDEKLPDVVGDAARRAVQALGLHFGAVDVLHNEHHDKAAVLEINTAPGLDNQTVLWYADALLRIAR